MLYLNKTDRNLGMNRPINRRDFLQGTAVAAASIGGTSLFAADVRIDPGKTS